MWVERVKWVWKLFVLSARGREGGCVSDTSPSQALVHVRRSACVYRPHCSCACDAAMHNYRRRRCRFLPYDMQNPSSLYAYGMTGHAALCFAHDPSRVRWTRMKKSAQDGEHATHEARADAAASLPKPPVTESATSVRRRRRMRRHHRDGWWWCGAAPCPATVRRVSAPPLRVAVVRCGCVRMPSPFAPPCDESVDVMRCRCRLSHEPYVDGLVVVHVSLESEFWCVGCA